MTQFFHGLLPFEIIMLAMGIVIFLALVFLLVWNVLKQRPFISLLAFFLLPVVLVGYPSIQSVQFKDGEISIQKYIQAVNNDPSDTTARQALSAALDDFKNNDRVQQNAGALATVADAQLALGNTDSASATIQKAAQMDSSSDKVKAAAQRVNRQIIAREQFREHISLLKDQLDKLQAQPEDTTITARVTQTLSEIKHPAYVDASSALVMAKAYAAVNQQQQSVKIIDQVLTADTGSTEAKQLKTRVLDNDFRSAKTVTPAQEKSLQQIKTVNPFVLRQVVTNTNK